MAGIRAGGKPVQRVEVEITDSSTAKNVHVYKTDPNNALGRDGDIWVKVPV